MCRYELSLGNAHAEFGERRLALMFAKRANIGESAYGRRRQMQFHARIALPRRAHTPGQRDGFQRFALTLQWDDAAAETPLPYPRTAVLRHPSDHPAPGTPS